VIAEREQAYDQGLEKLDFLSPSQDPLPPQELPSGAEILEEVERLFRRSRPDE
jgi:hypothetical protein